MSDQTTPPPATGLTVPAETEMQFSALVQLIRGSESMNDEERQYWINILPIMTDEQLRNLEDILTSEKKQLAAIDQKYSKPTSDMSGGIAVIEQKMKERKQKRLEIEKEEMLAEEKVESDILSQIETL